MELFIFTLINFSVINMISDRIERVEICPIFIELIIIFYEERSPLLFIFSFIPSKEGKSVLIKITLNIN